MLVSSQAVAAGSIEFKSGSFDGPDENVGVVFPTGGICVSAVFHAGPALTSPSSPGRP
ncbi:hypothetical protein MANY_32200 [Mycolicibacterium anyangense]|uniref:Uncharacterized protein n=1 Tax=Mycolicibacterium anyangense TaxID=1431246 RepID=A0A6N4WBY4_9MYCO|nr:hypothetical protein MANY_32200 [Mycolicibacterium anyangense]